MSMSMRLSRVPQRGLHWLSKARSQWYAGVHVSSIASVDSPRGAYYPVPNLTKERVMEGKPIVEITYCVP